MYLLRHHNVIEGAILKWTSPGWPRNSYTFQSEKDVGIVTDVGLKRLAKNRVR